jgi:hypothetical protein
VRRVAAQSSRKRPFTQARKPTTETGLGHTKVDSTVRYLGVELDDALSIAEKIDI